MINKEDKDAAAIVGGIAGAIVGGLFAGPAGAIALGRFGAWCGTKLADQ